MTTDPVPNQEELDETAKRAAEEAAAKDKNKKEIEEAAERAVEKALEKSGLSLTKEQIEELAAANARETIAELERVGAFDHIQPGGTEQPIPPTDPPAEVAGTSQQEVVGSGGDSEDGKDESPKKDTWAKKFMKLD